MKDNTIKAGFSGFIVEGKVKLQLPLNIKKDTPYRYGKECLLV